MAVYAANHIGGKWKCYKKPEFFDDPNDAELLATFTKKSEAIDYLKSQVEGLDPTTNLAILYGDGYCEVIGDQ